MYLIESFPNEVALKEALQYSKQYGELHEKKEETYEYCLLRERGNELRIAQESGVVTVIEFTQSGVNGILQMNGDTISLSDDFDSIKDESYYLRRGFINNIFRPKTSSVVLPWTDHIPLEEKIRIDTWARYISPVFTGRNIILYETLHFEDIYDAFDKKFWFRFSDGQEFPFPIFIKTIRKNCSEIIRDSEDFDEFCMGIMTDTGFIVSEVIDIAKDDDGKKEYRVYVMNGKPVNASRCVDYDMVEIPVEVSRFAQEFSHFHKDIFFSYVVDIALCEDGKYRVVELNNLSESGRYRSNDFSAILEGFSNNGQ